MLLGRILAAAGFHLVTGGSPGVEAGVGEAYSRRESLWPDPPSPRRTRVYAFKDAPERIDLTPKRIAEVGVESMEEVIELSLDRCDVLILVAGSGGTARVGRRAARRGIPVLPLGGTGGDAAKFLDELPSTSPETLDREALSILAGDPIAAIIQLPQIIRAIATEVRTPAEESGSSSATPAPPPNPPFPNAPPAPTPPKPKPSVKGPISKKPARKPAAPKTRSKRPGPTRKKK